MKNKILKFLLGGLLGASVISTGIVAVSSHEEKAANAATDIDAYYRNVDFSTADKMLSSIKSIISSGYKTLGYDGLLEAYHTTDKREDGYLKDYYSNITNFVIGGPKENAPYKKEGDGYNREHSIPQSWWGSGTSNQGCDAIIVVPADGYINNMRSNYPFGEVGNLEKSSANQFSKFGSSAISGVSTKVFEPNDMYKGDFARIYFYAVTRWNTTSWTGGNAGTCFKTNLNAPNYGLTDYALNLFVKWHDEDPVDEWELNRNENVYALQKNRNPYVDHPEWVDQIWGGTYPGSKELVSLSVSGTPNKLTYVAGEEFDPTGLTVTATYDDQSTADVTGKMSWSAITATTTSVTGTYRYGSTSKTITVDGIKIKTVKNISLTGTPTKTSYTAGQSFDPSGLTITATYSDDSTAIVTNSVTWSPSPLYVGCTSVTGTFGGCSVTVSGLTVEAASVYTLAKTTTDLAEGDKVIIACKNSNATAGDCSSSSMAEITSTFSGDEISSIGSGTVELIAKKSGSSWTFSNGENLLASSAAKNLNWNVGSTTWNVTISNGTAKIENTTATYGSIKFNSQAHMFRTYTSGQADVQIYHLPDSKPAIVHAESVTLSSQAEELTVGNTVTLTATVLPENAVDKSVTWTSSNNEVVTVENGVVTALKEGTATITATTVDGLLTASCTITVKTEGKIDPIPSGGEDPVPSGGEDPTPTPAPNNGCGGSIVATSSIVFAISLLGLAFILVRKHVKE